MDDMDREGAAGRVRLFPLPGVAMFPHVVAPLHIFEPRYRRMTADALADDRMIAMVRLLGDESPRPSIEVVGCLGRIIRHEQLADGRFNLLLLGQKRIRLVGEVLEPALPYRVAEAAVLEDRSPSPLDESAARESLVGRFRRVVAAAAGLDDEFFRLLEATESLGALTDVMAHSLPIDDDRKQRLLAEPDVAARVLLLDGWLADLTPSPPPGRSFPPPFSVN
jgi:Lon protease-like protein